MVSRHSVTASVALLLGALIAIPAEAHPRRARVTLVEPVYATVYVDRPVTRCRVEYVERRTGGSGTVAGPTLAGAIVGAAIGRQFGDGSGRDALTVIGAVAGSAVAHERALRRQGATVTVVREPIERCTTEYRRHAERRLSGYRVEYRYRGRLYHIHTREHPGREIIVEHRS